MNRRRGEELEGRWSAVIVVVSVAGSRSVPPSFPSMLMCHGTHDTSMFAFVFFSGKVVAVSTNFCNFRWFNPGSSFVIEASEDVLSAWQWILNSTTALVMRSSSIVRVMAFYIPCE